MTLWSTGNHDRNPVQGLRCTVANRGLVSREPLHRRIYYGADFHAVLRPAVWNRITTVYGVISHAWSRRNTAGKRGLFSVVFCM